MSQRENKIMRHKILKIYSKRQRTGSLARIISSDLTMVNELIRTYSQCPRINMFSRKK